METQSEQEKMDQLMAELQGDTGKGDTKDPAPAASAPVESGDPDTELSEQEKMDQLMAELQGGADTGQQAAPAATEPAKAADSDEELGEQEKMDRLMAELQGNTGSAGDADTRQPDESQVAPDADDSEPPEDAPAPAATEQNGAAGEFQPLDDADLNGSGEAEEDPVPQEQETFVALEDDEEDLDGYGDEDVDEEPEIEPGPDVAAEPTPEIRPKPVPRERKSLFDIQEERVAALPERARQGQWPRIVLVSSGITLFLAALFVGLMVYKNRGVVGPEKAVSQIEEPQAQRPAEPGQEEKPAALPEQEDTDNRETLVENPADNIIQGRFETIDTLRQSLQIKQTEITKLKKEYETGIEQSMDVIAGLARTNNIKDFKAAMKVGRIAFELQTIQRRKAYIRKLEGPYNRLLSGNEALLYIKRLTEIDLAVAPFVGGLGTGQLLKRIDAEIDRHQLTNDKLLVAAGDAEAPGLESLWRETLSKGRSKGAAGGSTAGQSGENALPVEEVKLSNNEIWEQICNGQPDNKYRLTELTSEAAVCLSKWKGKELFLNRLTTLTQRQARALSDWKGEWIGLNGLTEMDRATARALFKWKGKRLSLNGFAEFPPGVARYLVKWKGQQLELMGLEILSHKTAVYFSEWKKDGGKLYIPNKFYRRK